jgi:hypothetical protein
MIQSIFAYISFLYSNEVMAIELLELMNREIHLEGDLKEEVCRLRLALERLFSKLIGEGYAVKTIIAFVLCINLHLGFFSLVT